MVFGRMFFTGRLFVTGEEVSHALETIHIAVISESDT